MEGDQGAAAADQRGSKNSTQPCQPGPAPRSWVDGNEMRVTARAHSPRQLTNQLTMYVTN